MNLAPRMTLNTMEVSRKVSSLKSRTEEYDFSETWEEIFERFSLTTDKLNANKSIYILCISEDKI